MLPRLMLMTMLSARQSLLTFRRSLRVAAVMTAMQMCSCRLLHQQGRLLDGLLWMLRVRLDMMVSSSTAMLSDRLLWALCPVSRPGCGMCW